jgi:hypothetical protein
VRIGSVKEKLDTALGVARTSAAVAGEWQRRAEAAELYRCAAPSSAQALQRSMCTSDGRLRLRLRTGPPRLLGLTLPWRVPARIGPAQHAAREPIHSSPCGLTPAD